MQQLLLTGVLLINKFLNVEVFFKKQIYIVMHFEDMNQIFVEW